MTQERIAEARIMIEQCRLLTLKAAYMMDTVGNKVARKEIAMIKVAAPNMACTVIDWAMQAFGGAGITADYGLAKAYANARLLRLADGPDEVHRNQIARLELKPYVNTVSERGANAFVPPARRGAGPRPPAPLRRLGNVSGGCRRRHGLAAELAQDGGEFVCGTPDLVLVGAAQNQRRAEVAVADEGVAADLQRWVALL